MKERSLLFTGFFIQLTTMSFGRFVYTLIMPSMMETLGFSPTRMGLLGTGIVAGYLLFSYGSGKCSNLIGPGRTVKLSVALVQVSLLCLGSFSRYTALLLASIGLGAGAAGSYIPLIHMLNCRFSSKGKAFGIVMGGAGAGIVLCGYLVPPLLSLSDMLGYRLSWYVLGAVNLIVMIASLVFLKTGEEGRGRSAEDKKEKILDSYRGNAPLILVTVIYFLLGFAYIIYVTYFGTYAIVEAGYSEKSTGFMWSLFGVNMIYSGLLWGAFADRSEKTTIVLIPGALLALSVGIVLVPVKPLFYVSTFLFGLSFMGYITLIASLMSGMVRTGNLGMFFGAATLIHGGGQVFAAFLGGYLYDLTGTFRIPFLLSLAVLLLCLLLLFRLRGILRSRGT